MVTRDLEAHVLVDIPVEFVHTLCWILKIQPWAFWSDVKSTEGIGSPAVVASVPMVVRVSICLVLVNVVALAIQNRVALECLREVTSCVILIRDLECQHDWSE